MGMNMFAAQLALSAKVSSSEGKGQPFEPMKLGESVRAKKSFGAVLRTARQGADSMDTQKVDGRRPSQATESRERMKREDGPSVTDRGEQSSENHTEDTAAVSGRPAADTETDNQNSAARGETGPSQSGWSMGADTETPKNTDRPMANDLVPTDLLLALSHTLPPHPQVSDSTIPTSNDLTSASDEGGGVLTANQGETISSPIMPGLTLPEGTGAHPEAEPEKSALALPESVRSVASVNARQAAAPIDVSAQAEEGTMPISQIRDTAVQPVADVATPAPIDGKEGSQSGIASQALPPSLHQAASGDGQYQPEQELSRLEGIVPRSTGVPAQPVHAKSMDTPLSKRMEATSRMSQREGVGESNQASAEMPRASAWSDHMTPSDAGRSEEEGPQQHSSQEMPWSSPDRDTEDLPHHSSDHSIQTIAVGNMTPAQPRANEASTLPFTDRIVPVPPAPTAEPHVSQIGRAVLLQVAEPDLGHIHIRVAMTNDVVHAYLSSDRPEVGQFLVTGHDRLQSALQANGLEMGQFRVDIDRQHAGRSFQQGQSQEHNRMSQPSTTGPEEAHGTTRTPDYRVAGYTGMLNLVA